MLKSIYLLLLLLLIAPTAVFSQKSYDGIILGTIIDAETQSPVEDAVIEILNIGNKTTTDSTGNFFPKSEIRFLSDKNFRNRL
ncbi:MAG: hypothetical protein IPG09_02530 [Ignavibacteria bacterium]|nr:hypothetical protein [Ignavibacteria bacterium]